MGYFASAAQLLIEFAFGALLTLFLLRVLAEYFRVAFHNPVCQFVYRTTHPVLAPLQRVLPATGKFNCSALLVAWLLEVVKLTLLCALAGFLPHLFGLLLLALAELFDFVLLLYIVLIFGWALMSMFAAPAHPLVQLVDQLVAPLMRPLQRRVPDLGGIDFSPAIAILALLLARILLAQPLIDLGSQLLR